MQGFAAPEYEHVVDAFEKSADAAGEDAAAVCVTVEGEVVVDVARGPWKPDSLVCVFSVTKGLAALCAQMLYDRGLLDVTAPVTRYWPEFGVNGKEATTVAQLLNHTSGVLTVPRYWEEVGPDSSGLLDHDRMASLVAAAPPAWPPGSAFAYHAFTYGWMVGELVRRLDGRSLGRFFAEEVARPLGLDLFIGLPDDQAGRVLESEPPADAMDPVVFAGVAEDLLAGGPTSLEAWSFASMFVPLGTVDVQQWLASFMNRPDTRRAELPAGNAIGDARSIALMYAALANGRGGLVSPDAIDVFTEPHTVADGTATGMGLGYAVYGPGFGGPATTWRAFGHSGAGGNLGLADPTRRLSYGYVKNRMILDQDAAWAPLRAL